MMIPLTDLFLSEENTKEYRYSFGISEVNGCRVVEAPETIVTLVHRKNRKIEITTEGSVVLSIPCDRCLTPVETPVSFSLFRKIDVPSRTDEEGDEVDFIEGENIDLDVPVLDEIHMNYPMRILCREDCKGICEKCGANLNLNACDCGKEAPDGPMAELLKKIKVDIR